MPTHLGRRKLCPLSRNAWMVGPRSAGLFVAVGILAACARPAMRDTQAPEVAIPSQPPTAPRVSSGLRSHPDWSR